MLADTEDVEGRFAIIYTGVKAAASHLDGGAQAFETTVYGNIILLFLQALSGDAPSTWYAVVPTGPLGPRLVDAGLAVQPKPSDPTFAVVPVSWEDSFGRLEKMTAEHRARLRMKQAWTCRLEKIEHAVPPTEPSLVRGAQISSNVFAGWSSGVEAIWIVRASCASGPALFAITAKRDGTAKVLLAAI